LPSNKLENGARYELEVIRLPKGSYADYTPGSGNNYGPMNNSISNPLGLNQASEIAGDISNSRPRILFKMEFRLSDYNSLEEKLDIINAEPTEMAKSGLSKKGIINEKFDVVELEGVGVNVGLITGTNRMSNTWVDDLMENYFDWSPKTVDLKLPGGDGNEEKSSGGNDTPTNYIYVTHSFTDDVQPKYWVLMSKGASDGSIRISNQLTKLKALYNNSRNKLRSAILSAYMDEYEDLDEDIPNYEVDQIFRDELIKHGLYDLYFYKANEISNDTYITDIRYRLPHGQTTTSYKIPFVKN